MKRSYLLAPTLSLCLMGWAGCAHQEDNMPRTGTAAPPPAHTVVRLAPDFAIQGANVKSLRALRGQAVVLLVADSPRTGAFRAQLRKLREDYSDFASRETVFVAAFKSGGGAVHSDVPFALATNGPAVAAAYEVKDDMNVIIIGRDGNVDYQTWKKITSQRIRDVIQNSYSVQEGRRKSSVENGGG